MGTDGYKLVWMGKDGCIGKKGSKNKGKRTPNNRLAHVFGCMVTGKKCNMLTKMIMTCREHQGEKKGEVRGAVDAINTLK